VSGNCPGHSLTQTVTDRSSLGETLAQNVKAGTVEARPWSRCFSSCGVPPWCVSGIGENNAAPRGIHPGALPSSNHCIMVDPVLQRRGLSVRRSTGRIKPQNSRRTTICTGRLILLMRWNLKLRRNNKRSESRNRFSCTDCCEDGGWGCSGSATAVPEGGRADLVLSRLCFHR